MKKIRFLLLFVLFAMSLGGCGSASTSLDSTPPTVNVATPADGAIDVPVNTTVSITFSEPVDAASFTSTDFLLSTGGTNVAGAINISGATATFQPAADLSAGVTYTATVKGTVTDLAGNALGSDHSWGFTTVTAAGPAWSTPTMLNTAGETTYSGFSVPLVQMDDQGNAIAVWLQKANPSTTARELWTSRYAAPTATTAGAWSLPQVLATPGSGEVIHDDPALAMNSAGQAILVWRVYVSAQDQSYLYSRSFDPAGGWGAVETVGSADGGTLMRMVLDDSGNATVVWERAKPIPGNPTTGRFKTVGANRYAPGIGWSPEVILEDLDFSIPYSYVKVPTLALDTTGNVTAIWMMNDTSNYHIHAARLVGGIWSSVATLQTAPSYIQPFMAAGADGSGNVTVAWRQNASSGFNLTLWAAQFDATGSSWGSPVQLADALDLTSSDLAVDAGGTAMVVWRQTSASNQEIMSRLYTPGSGWAPPVSVLGTNLQTAPDTSSETRIVSSGSGFFWAGWNANGPVSLSTIYANQYDPVTAWDTPDIVQGQSATDAALPKLAANPSGDAVMIWGSVYDQFGDNATWGSLYR